MGDDDGSAPRGRRLPLIALVLATLTVGVVAGYLLRGATETPPAPPASASAPSTRPVAPAEQPAPPSAPCTAAAEHGGDVLVQLERAVAAIAALDPGALRAVVDEVERLRGQMQNAVDACGADGGGPAGPGAGPPTAAVPSTPR